MSKIVEKAVHSHLTNLDFRLKSCTVIAASQLSDEILYSMDNGCLTGAVFLDLTNVVAGLA